MFSFFLVNIYEWDCWVICKCMFSFIINGVFAKLCYFLFTSAVYESFSCPISIPTLGIVCLLNFSHSSEFVVVFHCGFNLCFCDD